MVYLERATQALRDGGSLKDDSLLQYLALGRGTHQPDLGLRMAPRLERSTTDNFGRGRNLKGE